MQVHRLISGGSFLGAALGLCLSAHAQVLDFQHLEQNNNSVNNVGDIVTEDGFEITKNPGEPFQFAVFGTQEPRYPGSTALFNNTVNGLIRLAKIGGGAFDVESIDFAMLNGGGTVTINLTGTRADNTTVQQQIVHTDSGLPLDLVTYTLNGFTGVVRVEWNQVSPFHQFDNIVIGGGGFNISLSGSCPGQKTLSWSGAGAGQMGILIGNGPGNFTIPGGPCQGTQLGLSGPGGLQLFNIISTQGGQGQATATVGTAACGKWVQAIKTNNCQTSNATGPI